MLSLMGSSKSADNKQGRANLKINNKIWGNINYKGNNQKRGRENSMTDYDHQFLSGIWEQYYNLPFWNRRFKNRIPKEAFETNLMQRARKLEPRRQRKLGKGLWGKRE